MIVVTGAAGFIGSCLVGQLNRAGEDDLLLVDAFDREDKVGNLADKRYRVKMERGVFPEWLEKNADSVRMLCHLGARTDTTEFDEQVFEALNTGYSRRVWQACAKYGIPLVYASSAATYGLGELGYSDDHALVDRLSPLNPYGRSKNDFDAWALRQASEHEPAASPESDPKASTDRPMVAAPPFWAGVKFFNVYGPNEYHKGRMASVVLHAYRQIRETGSMKLFRSHRADVADGMQSRDFVYVLDVVKVLQFLMEGRAPSGLYNLGTGKARPFLDLARAVFSSMDIEPDIRYVDTPADIRDTYQYFTEARMEKLRAAGYEAPFRSLEAGIDDYVRNYLLTNTYY